MLERKKVILFTQSKYLQLHRLLIKKNIYNPIKKKLWKEKIMIIGQNGIYQMVMNFRIKKEI